jgi:hypothetical protein
MFDRHHVAPFDYTGFSAKVLERVDSSEPDRDCKDDRAPYDLLPNGFVMEGSEPTCLVSRQADSGKRDTQKVNASDTQADNAGRSTSVHDSSPQSPRIRGMFIAVRE